MADSLPFELGDKDVLIAVMGMTGSGKSTIINLATQSETLTVGHGIQSCTNTVDRGPPFELEGRRVILFDTPGFDDTNKSEAEVLQIIAQELEKLFRKQVTLHGILYIHRISEIRVGGVAKANFRIFRKLCGDNSLKNVIIVTNMWSKVCEEEGMRRVAELSELEDFFKSALEKKARLMHHKRDTVESIHEIIGAIMENHPVPLDIQEELVNEGKDISSTAAGQEIDKRLAEKIAEYEEKLKKQAEEAEDARKQADEESRKELLEEKARGEEQVKAMREEKENMAKAYAAAQAQMLEDMKRMLKENEEAQARRDEEMARERRQNEEQRAKMQRENAEAQARRDEEMARERKENDVRRDNERARERRENEEERAKIRRENAEAQARRDEEMARERKQNEEQRAKMQRENAEAQARRDEEMARERKQNEEQRAKMQRENAEGE